MFTTRNITVFIALVGLSMALAGHVWPGAFVLVAALAVIALYEFTAEDDDETETLFAYPPNAEDDGDAEEARDREIERRIAARRRSTPRPAFRTFGGDVDIYCPASETDQARPEQVKRIGWSS